MSKRILITGATGFVGRQVVSALVNHDVELHLVVRKGKESLVNEFPRVAKIIKTKDLFSEDVNWWERQCQGVDIVVHLAWYAEPGLYLNSTLNIDCLIGSLNIARAAASVGIKRFVGIGTCFEYELSAGVLSVDTPLNPVTPYADTKAALYLSLSDFLPDRGIEFAWCRLFYLFGEGEDSRRLVPYIRAMLEKGEPAELTSGKQIRDFLDVRVAGKMIVDVILGDFSGPVNICSGVPITVRQLAEKIADEYGRSDLLHFGVRCDNAVDPSCVLGVPNMK